jgi:FHS family L-fucose permease-like MFS transporter
MIGRFEGTFLMRFIISNRLLVIYSALCIALLVIIVLNEGMMSVYGLISVEFFMSIMFLTIFLLSGQ